MTKAQEYAAKLEEKKVYNQRYTQYSFELLNPHRLEFQAGQYVSLLVNEKGERRSYSICSSPGIKHGFEILVDLSPGGVGSYFLENLKFGDDISVLAPLGQFVIPEETQEKALVLVATGSGIAPMRSMVLDLLQEKHDKRPITLYWGLRHMTDLFWENDFQDLVDYFPNFQFHPVLSRAKDQWPLCRGHVTDCLSLHGLPENAGFYLCGSRAMIDDTSKLLVSKNIDQAKIHYEKFY